MWGFPVAVWTSTDLWHQAGAITMSRGRENGEMPDERGESTPTVMVSWALLDAECPFTGV
jgi:hypothetical protein